jgi:hypothetical protein
VIQTINNIIKTHGGEINVESKEAKDLSADLSDEALAKLEAMAKAGRSLKFKYPLIKNKECEPV